MYVNYNIVHGGESTVDAFVILIKTRMHSSRMRIAHTLTVVSRSVWGACMPPTMHAPHMPPRHAHLPPTMHASLFVIGYHWLPLATIDLVGDNGEFEV